MEKLVSVIISARNEYPNVVHSVHSILSDLGSFLKPQEFEVIIVDNCSDDRVEPQRATSGTSDFLRTRGMFHSGVVKVLYDPIAGNVSARNKGVAIAKGKYVFFSDAHMAFTPGFHKRMLDTCIETGGIVHPAYSWMGAYPPQPSYQYSLKLGEEFKGTWANYKVADEWFYILGSGHCSLVVEREQFHRFRGYPDYLRCYGGGELFLAAKWWMLGSTVVSEPRAHCYHLSSGRGYSYNHDDYIHNVFHSALVLGADAWAERTFLNYLRKNRPDVLDELWSQARVEATDQREFMALNRSMTFNDLVRQRPWDRLNDKRHGRHNSGTLIYHQSWVDLVRKESPEVYELWRRSEAQQELSAFIEAHLGEFVYKPR